MPAAMGKTHTWRFAKRPISNVVSQNIGLRDYFLFSFPVFLAYVISLIITWAIQLGKMLKT